MICDLIGQMGFTSVFTFWVLLYRLLHLIAQMIYKTLCAGIFCITVADAAKFMFFFVQHYYLSTDHNLLSYHSISSLPTHTQGSSFTTHRLFSDSKAVFSVGGWSHTPLHCLWQNAHWCWCLCCTAGHPYCSSIPSSNLFSKQPTVQYARYSILVPLLFNQPWRIVSGVMVWEKGTHVWSEAHVSVGAHVVNRFTW